jgi:hypothetical protein
MEVNNPILITDMRKMNGVGGQNKYGKTAIRIARGFEMITPDVNRWNGLRG